MLPRPPPPVSRTRKVTKAPITTREMDELHQQAPVVTLLKAHDIFFCAIPNGHVRSKRQHIQASAEGVIAGMPDLMIFATPPLVPWAKGVALEMKRRAGRSKDVRSEQRSALARFAREGYIPLVGYGTWDAVSLLKELGFFPSVLLRPTQIPHPRKIARLRALIARKAQTWEFYSQEDANDSHEEQGEVEHGDA